MVWGEGRGCMFTWLHTCVPDSCKYNFCNPTFRKCCRFRLLCWLTKTYQLACTVLYVVATSIISHFKSRYKLFCWTLDHVFRDIHVWVTINNLAKNCCLLFEFCFFLVLEVFCEQVPKWVSWSRKWAECLRKFRRVAFSYHLFCSATIGIIQGLRLIWLFKFKSWLNRSWWHTCSFHLTLLTLIGLLVLYEYFSILWKPVWHEILSNWNQWCFFFSGTFSVGYN